MTPWSIYTRNWGLEGIKDERLTKIMKGIWANFVKICSRLNVVDNIPPPNASSAKQSRQMTSVLHEEKIEVIKLEITLSFRIRFR